MNQREQFNLKAIINIILFSTLILGTSVKAQNIIGTFNPKEDFNFNLLYQITPNTSVYKLASQSEGEGIYKLELDSTITKGVYKIIYGTPMDENLFYVLYDGKQDIKYLFDKKKGVAFEDELNKLFHNYLQTRAELHEKLISALAEEGTNVKSINKLMIEAKKIQKEMEAKVKGNYFETFVTSLAFNLPEEYHSTTEFREYYKNHFLDNFDFNDSKLQASFLPSGIIRDYYHSFSGTDNQQILSEIVNHVNVENKYFAKNILSDLWSILKDDNYVDATFLAEKLIPIAEEARDANMVAKLQRYVRLAIGAKAPDFIIGNSLDLKTQTLHQIQGSEYYVLAFWNSRCGHCMRQMPELHWNMKKRAERVKAIAIGLEADSVKWLEEIQNFSHFTNTMFMGDDKRIIDELYDIRVTPAYFILNKDKEFIAKPKNLEALLEELDKLGL